MHTKFLIIGLAVVFGTQATGAAAARFDISARQKTVSKEETATQELPRGSTHMEVRKMVYLFEIRNESTDYSQDELTVRWAVMMEASDGRPYPGPRGETATILPFGRTVTLETDVIPVAERQWQGAAGRRNAEIGQVIRGYGLQILAPDGQVLAEDYTPETLRDEIRWERPEPPAASDQVGRDGRPRLDRPPRPGRFRDPVRPPLP